MGYKIKQHPVLIHGVFPSGFRDPIRGMLFQIFKINKLFPNLSQLSCN